MLVQARAHWEAELPELAVQVGVMRPARRWRGGTALFQPRRTSSSTSRSLTSTTSALIDRSVAQFGLLDVAVNNVGAEGRAGPATDELQKRRWSPGIT